MHVYIKKIKSSITIIKKIPKARAKRIPNISSSEDFFNELIPIYFDALRKSGFHKNTTFIPITTNSETNNRQARKRKAICFNPPNYLSAKTNVERIFLKFNKKYF